MFSNCRVARSIEDGEELLVKSRVSVKSKSDLDEEILYGIIKQKSNNKLFFLFRFNAWLYNRYGEELREEKREKKQIRIDAKNERRHRKGKELVNSSNLTWRDRLVENIGEPPAVYDSLKTEISVEQLDIYLQKNGYFAGEVQHVKKNRTKRKVKSYYTIYPGHPHVVDSVQWTVKDPGINAELSNLKELANEKLGSRFDVETLDSDREAMSNYLNNSGYYDFSKEYIRYEVDTIGRDRTAQLNVIISNPMVGSYENPDSLVDQWHKKYVIGRINFHLDYDPLSSDYEPTDRIIDGRYMIEYVESLDFESNVLFDNILFTSGEYYQLVHERATYKKLRNLGVFTYMNIKFEEEGINNGKHTLAVHIYLNTGKSQGISMEITGTHRDGIWGANAKAGYFHNNGFSGAERLTFNMSFGAEAQKSLVDTTEVSLTDNLRLNTLLIGTEFGLEFHKLVGFKKLSKRYSSPLTKISFVPNYQIRPDFQRWLFEGSFTWRFHENEKKTIYLSPLDVSLIKITNSLTFQERLDEINNPFLINSYRDHIISTFPKGSWEYSSQTQSFQRKYMYNRAGLECAGFILRNVWLPLFGGVKDDIGAYRIFDTRFAQYVKIENDTRYYVNFSKNHGMAFRGDVGLGVPIGNSNVLPFEKSFFAGGANGIRAWQARTLGPGSYRDTSSVTTFNNLGEFKLTFSSEYRFDLTNLIDGALFVDAGNVWIIDDENNRPGAELSDLFSEVAFGAGLGLRLDFDFFLVRFDFGFKLKDPSLIKGERWAWQPKDDYNAYVQDLFDRGLTDQTKYNFTPNLNLGIGYPF